MNLCRISITSYFNPRPPRGGRPFRNQLKTAFTSISIHALREEGDLRLTCIPATAGISIHALREEGDKVSDKRKQTALIFQSTPSARRATHHRQQDRH